MTGQTHERHRIPLCRALAAAARGPAAADRPGAVHRRSRLAAHAARGPGAQPGGACPHPLGRSVARRGDARRRARAQRRRSAAAAAAGARGADLDAEQMDDGDPAQIPQPAAAAAWRTTRCAMSARRSRSSSPRPATRPRTRPSWSACDLEELPAVVDPEAALRPDSPIVHDRYSTNLIGAFSVGRGDVDAAFATAPAPAAAPLLPPPLRRGADGVPRRRRRLRSAHRLGDDLVVDPGGALGAPRSGGAARSARGAGALRRARCRRRLWRQGPCLPRRPADHLSRAQARPPGALDRGAPRAHDERDPFARPVARCRGRASTTTAVSWRCATTTSSIAAPGTRSARASPTTPRST